jgi:UDP-N-acetylmuramate dehydrogenase
MPAAYSLARNVPLRAWNTFRLDAQADVFATVHDASALPAVLADPALAGMPTLVLGRGSNVLFAARRYEGAIVHLAGATARVERQDHSHAWVHVDAGFEWDALVDWTIDRGLQGLENLALIPGQAGAAPIQNIGAYGAEIADCVVSVDAFDRAAGAFARLDNADCGFGYRDSVFKRDADRRIVTALQLRLARGGGTDLRYAGLQDELDAMGGAPPTPRNVADAVRRIRRRKLPDPALVGNAGSFFKNPVVTSALATELHERFQALPVYPTQDPATRKLSAAWLIERAGWRGFRSGDAGVSDRHALVLVNHGAATGTQLLDVARRVAASVATTFGVPLEPEPRIVGAAFAA